MPLQAGCSPEQIVGFKIAVHPSSVVDQGQHARDFAERDGKIFLRLRRIQVPERLALDPVKDEIGTLTLPAEGESARQTVVAEFAKERELVREGFVLAPIVGRVGPLQRDRTAVDRVRDIVNIGEAAGGNAPAAVWADL